MQLTGDGTTVAVVADDTAVTAQLLLELAELVEGECLILALCTLLNLVGAAGVCAPVETAALGAHLFLEFTGFPIEDASLAAPCWLQW